MRRPFTRDLKALYKLRTRTLQFGDVSHKEVKREVKVIGQLAPFRLGLPEMASPLKGTSLGGNRVLGSGALQWDPSSPKWHLRPLPTGKGKRQTDFTSVLQLLFPFPIPS